MLAVYVDENEVIPIRRRFGQRFFVCLAGIDLVSSYTQDLVAHRSQYISRTNVKYVVLLRISAVTILTVKQECACALPATHAAANTTSRKNY